MRLDQIEIESQSGLKTYEYVPITPESLDKMKELDKGVGEAKYNDSQVNKIVKDLKGDGFKNNLLRQSYETEVKGLADLRDDLLKQGLSKEEVAKQLNQARRDLGIKYKDMTPQPLRDYIYEVNQGRYGDPLGPTFDDLIESGKSVEQIIKSSSKYNSDVDKLLSGFEDWLRRQ